MCEGYHLRHIDALKKMNENDHNYIFNHITKHLVTAKDIFLTTGCLRII